MCAYFFLNTPIPPSTCFTKGLMCDARDAIKPNRASKPPIVATEKREGLAKRQKVEMVTDGDDKHDEERREEEFEEEEESGTRKGEEEEGEGEREEEEESEEGREAAKKGFAGHIERSERYDVTHDKSMTVLR